MFSKFKDQISDVLADAGGRTAAVRVIVSGACASHTDFVKDPERWRNELRAIALNEAGEGVWLEKIIFETRSLSSQAPDGLLSEILDSINGSDGEAAVLNESDDATLKKLLEKLPPELKSGDDAFSLDNPGWIRKSLMKGMEHVMASLVDIRGQMKFLSLDLLAYGPFTNVSILPPAGKPAFIYGLTGREKLCPKDHGTPVRHPARTADTSMTTTCSALERKYNARRSRALRHCRKGTKTHCWTRGNSCTRPSDLRIPRRDPLEVFEKMYGSEPSHW